MAQLKKVPLGAVVGLALGCPGNAMEHWANHKTRPTKPQPKVIRTKGGSCSSGLPGTKSPRGPSGLRPPRSRPPDVRIRLPNRPCPRPCCRKLQKPRNIRGSESAAGGLVSKSGVPENWRCPFGFPANQTILLGCPAQWGPCDSEWLWVGNIPFSFLN